MLPETLDFYRRTKLDSVIAVDPSLEQPLTHVKVFHKEYPRLPRIPLPPVEPVGRPPSARTFSGTPLPLARVAEILHSCSIVDPGREPEQRTYPSAGARFPIETYLIAFAIAGLDPGAYHYAIRASALEQLWKQDLRPREQEIVSPFVSNPASALVLTSVIARAEVKYGHKAYPYSLLEAGHMAQNYALACARARVGCCPIGGFVNDSLSQILDLTPDEIPLYVIALGLE